tara:strand:- start:3398 stop:4387 length:990 start_codon:yes stop_codon:yes gene_type:complete
MDLLAYRIPNESSVEKLGSFKVVKNDVQKSNGFIVSNFYVTKQLVFESNDKAHFDPLDYALHLNEQQPISISKERYIKQGKLALKLMPQKAINKVVLSRIKTCMLDTDKYWELYTKLCESYPKAFVYLISSPHFGTWIGATPETLVESNGEKSKTMSLAGTKEVSKGLEWSSKERQEQQFVTEYITSELKNQGTKDININGPHTATAGNIEHLRTDISFNLNKKHPLDIAMGLHPTPAVNGVPKEQSKRLIEQIELEGSNQDRSLYSGYIGLVSETTSKLYVNLRCCQLTKNKAHIYVGGGYTLQSKVENEWEETESKSETLTRIFDLL